MEKGAVLVCGLEVLGCVKMSGVKLMFGDMGVSEEFVEKTEDILVISVLSYSVGAEGDC